MLAVLEFLKSLVSIIPFIDKLFSLFRKTPTQKIEEALQDSRENLEYFKRTGRKKK